MNNQNKFERRFSYNLKDIVNCLTKQLFNFQLRILL